MLLFVLFSAIALVVLVQSGSGDNPHCIKVTGSNENEYDAKYGRDKDGLHYENLQDSTKTIIYSQQYWTGGWMLFDGNTFKDACFGQLFDDLLTSSSMGWVVNKDMELSEVDTSVAKAFTYDGVEWIITTRTSCETDHTKAEYIVLRDQYDERIIRYGDLGVTTVGDVKVWNVKLCTRCPSLAICPGASFKLSITNCINMASSFITEEETSSSTGHNMRPSVWFLLGAGFLIISALVIMVLLYRKRRLMAVTALEEIAGHERDEDTEEEEDVKCEIGSTGNHNQVETL